MLYTFCISNNFILVVLDIRFYFIFRVHINEHILINGKLTIYKLKMVSFFKEEGNQPIINFLTHGISQAIKYELCVSY